MSRDIFFIDLFKKFIWVANCHSGRSRPEQRFPSFHSG